jgi:hypothetical protein
MEAPAGAPAAASERRPKENVAPATSQYQRDKLPTKGILRKADDAAW